MHQFFLTLFLFTQFLMIKILFKYTKYGKGFICVNKFNR